MAHVVKEGSGDKLGEVVALEEKKELDSKSDSMSSEVGEFDNDPTQ